MEGDDTTKLLQMAVSALNWGTGDPSSSVTGDPILQLTRGTTGNKPDVRTEGTSISSSERFTDMLNW